VEGLRRKSFASLFVPFFVVPPPKNAPPEESLKVLERLFVLMPKTPGIGSTLIYNEARNLYSEIKAETESKTTTH